jgi:putative transposase
MPNYVHPLIHPRLPIAKIMRGMKGVSSRDANRILGREGRAFWQDEYEFGKIRSYIEVNPVSAGLVKKAEDWAWSNAGKIEWR